MNERMNKWISQNTLFLDVYLPFIFIFYFLSEGGKVGQRDDKNKTTANSFDLFAKTLKTYMMTKKNVQRYI